ncbi:hypothetical protein [Massilia sp. CCM 8734]|uniref:hypothetical protein n=1 Tax=Massilia sp. CCM 8734 TaxID=2609283 RepID=UPI001420BC35|nr:hypothetical protein [Massilia sp. CCM 8734]NIA00587.1 hypothetical protein [Massilia sp. CCM 8734]
MLAKKAKLLGAIRLPDTAFKENPLVLRRPDPAGAGVTKAAKPRGKPRPCGARSWPVPAQGKIIRQDRFPRLCVHGAVRDLFAQAALCPVYGAAIHLSACNFL